MKRLFAVWVLLTFVPAAGGHAETYRAQAPSSITVDVTPNGLVVHQRSVRYEVFSAVPDDIVVGMRFGNRLATITTVSDLADDDETTTIEVTVDALSGAAPRRITAFSDQGADGAISPPYFVTTQRGCCSPLTRHHVRNIETGKLLFTATGPGPAGLAALMTVPNQHPTIERWAAFEGRPDGGNEDRAMLGYLRYGDRNGAIDTVVLRMNVAEQPDEFILDLPSCGALLWRETGQQPAQGQPHRPDAGTCFEPQALSYSMPFFTRDHDLRGLTGIELELSLDGKVYAAIPIQDDHLDLAHARLAGGMSVMAAPRSP